MLTDTGTSRSFIRTTISRTRITVTNIDFHVTGGAAPPERHRGLGRTSQIAAGSSPASRTAISSRSSSGMNNPVLENHSDKLRRRLEILAIHINLLSLLSFGQVGLETA
jgi:hypothetical protein